MSPAAILIWPLVAALMGAVATDASKPQANQSAPAVGIVKDKETPSIEKKTTKEGAASEAPSNGDEFRALYRWISEYWQQTSTQAQRVNHERDLRKRINRPQPKLRSTLHESRSKC